MDKGRHSWYTFEEGLTWGRRSQVHRNSGESREQKNLGKKLKPLVRKMRYGTESRGGTRRELNAEISMFNVKRDF